MSINWMLVTQNWIDHQSGNHTIFRVGVKSTNAIFLAPDVSDIKLDIADIKLAIGYFCTGYLFF